jgi:heme/copper-type cytochrome/quinol oxidase subunit 2
MNVHAGTARPQRMSSGAAMLRVLLTLLLFFVVFIPFLIAPVLALVVGYLVYLVWRSRGSRQPAPASGPSTTASASGFGAGTS